MIKASAGLNSGIPAHSSANLLSRLEASGERSSWLRTSSESSEGLGVGACGLRILGLWVRVQVACGVLGAGFGTHRIESSGGPFGGLGFMGFGLLLL